MKGVREGNIIADIEYKGKVTRVFLTQVMHIPDAEGKILCLKKLDQKGFEIHIVAGRKQIMKMDEVYTEVSLSGHVYKVKMKIVPAQESVLAAIKRDSDTTDLGTWHRRLGHLGNSILKKLATSETIKG